MESGQEKATNMVIGLLHTTADPSLKRISQKIQLWNHCAMMLLLQGLILTIAGLSTNYWVDILGDHFGLWSYCNEDGCSPLPYESLHDWIVWAQRFAGMSVVLYACAGCLLVTASCRRRDLHPLDAVCLMIFRGRLSYFEILVLVASALMLMTLCTVSFCVSEPMKVHTSWRVCLYGLGFVKMSAVCIIFPRHVFNREHR